MSTEEEEQTGLERRARALLEESLPRIHSRVRSRLSRARFAAVEEAGRSRSSFWRTLASSSRGVVPAGALAAAVLIAMLVWDGRAERDLTANESAAAFEDVELLADGEALELMEEWDAGFYEWAASETDVFIEASG